MAAFYRDNTTGGTIDPATGEPTSGQTKMNIKVYPGLKLNEGTYDIDHSGSGSAPATIDFDGASDQPVINFNGEITNLSIRQQGAPGQGTYFETFSSRCNSVKWLRFMNAGRVNEPEFDSGNLWIREVVGANNTFYHPLLTPAQIRQICDDHDCSPWLSTHHLMSNANVQAFASAFAGFTKPIVIEHSNEIWNSGFPQHNYAKTQTGPYDAIYSGQTQNIQAWHADKTDEIGETWKTTLSGQDVRVVWGSQLATPNFIVNSIDRSFRALSYIDAAAGAPYVGGPWAGSLSRTLAEVNGMTDAQIVQQARDDFNNRVKALVTTWIDEADTRGWDFYLYEFGSHLAAHKNHADRDDIDARFITASQSAEMGDFYQNEYLPWLRDNVDSVMMLYRDVGTDAWGHWQHEQGPASDRASAWLSLTV